MILLSSGEVVARLEGITLGPELEVREPVASSSRSKNTKNSKKKKAISVAMPDGGGSDGSDSNNDDDDGSGESEVDPGEEVSDNETRERLRTLLSAKMAKQTGPYIMHSSENDTYL